MKHKSPLTLYLQRIDLTRKDLHQRKQEVKDDIDKLDKLYKDAVVTAVSQKHQGNFNETINCNQLAHTGNQSDSDNSYHLSDNRSSKDLAPSSNWKKQNDIGDLGRAYTQQRCLLSDTMSFLESKLTELVKMKRNFQNEYPIMIKELVKRNLPTQDDLEDSVQEEFRKKKDIAVNKMKICLNDFHTAVSDKLNKDSTQELKNLLNTLQARCTSDRSRPQKKTKGCLSPRGKENSAFKRSSRSSSVSKERMLSKAKQLRVSKQTAIQADQSSILASSSTWGDQSSKQQEMLKVDSKDSAVSYKDRSEDLGVPDGKEPRVDVQVPEISSSVQDRGHAEGASFGETLNDSSLMTLSTVSATLGDSSVQTSDNSEVCLSGMSGAGSSPSDHQGSGPTYSAVLTRPPSSMRSRSRYIQLGLPEKQQDLNRVPDSYLYSHFPGGGRRESQGFHSRQPSYRGSFPRRSQSHQPSFGHHWQPAGQGGYHKPYFHERRAQSSYPAKHDDFHRLASPQVVTVGRYCQPMDVRKVTAFTGTSSDGSSVTSAALSSSQSGSVDDTNNLRGLNEDSHWLSGMSDDQFVTVKLIKTEDVKHHRGPGLVNRADRRNGFLYSKDRTLQELSDFILKKLKIYRRGGMRLWLFEEDKGLFLPRRMLKGHFMYNTLGSLNRNTVTLFVQIAEERERLFSFDHTNMRFVFVKAPSADTGNFVVKGHHNIDISKATKAVIQVLKRKFMPDCPSPLKLFIEMGNNKMLVVPHTPTNIPLKDNTCFATHHGDVLLLLEDFIGQDSELMDVSASTSYNQSTGGEPVVMPLSPYPTVPSTRQSVENPSEHNKTEGKVLETIDENALVEIETNEDGVRKEQHGMSPNSVKHVQQFVIPYDYPTSASSTDESLPSPDQSASASKKRDHRFPLWDLTSHYMARFHDNMEQPAMPDRRASDDNDGQRNAEETTLSDRTCDSVMVFSETDFLESVGFDSASVSITCEGSHFDETSVHVSNFNETSVFASDFYESSSAQGLTYDNFDNSSHSEHTESAKCKQNAAAPDRIQNSKHTEHQQHRREKTLSTGMAEEHTKLFEFEVEPPTGVANEGNPGGKPGRAAHSTEPSEVSQNEKELKRVASMLLPRAVLPRTVLPRTVLGRKEVVRGRQQVNGELDITPFTPNNSTGSVTSGGEHEAEGKPQSSQVTPPQSGATDSKQWEKDTPFTPVTPLSVAGSSDVFLSDDGGGEDDPSVYYTPQPAFVFPERDPGLQSTKLPAMDSSDDYGAQFLHSHLNADQISAITNCSSSFMAIRGPARLPPCPQTEQISAIPNISSSFMEIPVQHQLQNQSLAEHSASFSAIVAHNSDPACRGNSGEISQHQTNTSFESSVRQSGAPVLRNGSGRQHPAKKGENPGQRLADWRPCGNQPQSQLRAGKRFPPILLDKSQPHSQFPSKSDAVLVKEADPAIMQIGSRVLSIAKMSSLNANANVFIPRVPLSTRLDTVHEQENEEVSTASSVSGKSGGGDRGQEGQAQPAGSEVSLAATQHLRQPLQQPGSVATQPNSGCHAVAQVTGSHQDKVMSAPKSQREMPATTSALVASKLLPWPEVNPGNAEPSVFPYYPVLNRPGSTKPVGSGNLPACAPGTDGILLPPKQRHPDASRHVTFADQTYTANAGPQSNLQAAPYTKRGCFEKDENRTHYPKRVPKAVVMPQSLVSGRITNRQPDLMPVPRKRIGSGRFEERPWRYCIEVPKQIQPSYQSAPQAEVPQTLRTQSNPSHGHRHPPQSYNGADNFHRVPADGAQGAGLHYPESYQGYSAGACFQQGQVRSACKGRRGLQAVGSEHYHRRLQAVGSEHYHSDPQVWGIRNAVSSAGYQHANRRNSSAGTTLPWGYPKSTSSCHYSHEQYPEAYRQPRSSLGQYKHNNLAYRNHYEDPREFVSNRYMQDFRFKKHYLNQQHGAISSSDQSDTSVHAAESRYPNAQRFRRVNRPAKESEAESSAGSVTFHSEASNSENIPELPVSANSNTCSSSGSGSSDSNPAQATGPSQQPQRSRRGYIQLGLGDPVRPPFFRANSDPNA